MKYKNCDICKLSDRMTFCCVWEMGSFYKQNQRQREREREREKKRERKIDHQTTEFVRQSFVCVFILWKKTGKWERRWCNISFRREMFVFICLFEEVTKITAKIANRIMIVFYAVLCFGLEFATSFLALSLSLSLSMVVIIIIHSQFIESEQSEQV